MREVLIGSRVPAQSLRLQRRMHDVPAVSDQMPLWVKGSKTSRAAAVSVAPRLNELQGVVMSYIAGRGTRGATDEEITHDLKMNPSTARPRRIELVEMGKVRASTQTRPTVSGRSATVWVAR
jgi:hypothetical protein